MVIVLVKVALEILGKMEDQLIKCHQIQEQKKLVVVYLKTKMMIIKKIQLKNKDVQ